MPKKCVNSSRIGLIYWCGLEPRNGTSVQLERLLRGWWPRLVHFFWDAKTSGGTLCGESVYFEVSECWPLRRGARLIPWVNRFLSFGRLSLRRCRRDKLRVLAGEAGRDLGGLYVVVYNEEQATFARDVLRAIGTKPYILHLMDIIERSRLRRGRTPDLDWLVANARRVWGVSEKIAEEARRIRAADVSVVPLCAAPVDQIPPPARSAKDTFKIAVVGTIYGRKLSRSTLALDLLAEVLPEIASRASLELVTTRDPEETLPASLRPYLMAAGPLSTDETVRLQKGCHIAYLTVQYRKNSKLRYSIPSRIVDYLSCGLPVVACAEPGTAVWQFLKPLEGKCVTLVKDAGELEAALERYRTDNSFREGQKKFAEDYAAREFDERRWRDYVQTALGELLAKG